MRFMKKGPSFNATEQVLLERLNLTGMFVQLSFQVLL